MNAKFQQVSRCKRQDHVVNLGLTTEPFDLNQGFPGDTEVHQAELRLLLRFLFEKFLEPLNMDADDNLMNFN
jgi:hypothetical protein